ncbi:MAG: MurR/RpiR family transcriptional regulator [Paracoccaceae bacterium]
MDNDTAVPNRPDTVSALLGRMDASIDTLPKRLKQCASFTRGHLHLIAVSTVSDMAEASGVAPSVYIRFCQTLGFTGYSDMQALFRAQFTEFRPDYGKRLAQLPQASRNDTGKLLADFAEAGHKSLLYLSNTVTTGKLDQIARDMSKARVIHLLGLRRAFSVTSNMAYLFDQLGVPAQLHPGAGMLSAAETMFPEDCVFAVTFAPFSEETVGLSRDAAQKGVPVYGLSDSERCPVAEWAQGMLIAQEDEVAGFRAPTAAITLTTALAVAVKALQGRG